MHTYNSEERLMAGSTATHMARVLCAQGRIADAMRVFRVSWDDLLVSMAIFDWDMQTGTEPVQALAEVLCIRAFLDRVHMQDSGAAAAAMFSQFDSCITQLGSQPEYRDIHSLILTNWADHYRRCGAYESAEKLFSRAAQTARDPYVQGMTAYMRGALWLEANRQQHAMAYLTEAAKILLVESSGASRFVQHQLVSVLAFLHHSDLQDWCLSLGLSVISAPSIDDTFPSQPNHLWRRGDDQPNLAQAWRRLYVPFVGFTA